MLKISLQLIITALVSRNFKFVIEKSDSFDDKTVLIFVAAHGYPANSSYHSGTDWIDRQNIQSDKISNSRGAILMHYDVSEGSVIGCCAPWYAILRDIVSKAKANRTQTNK